MVAAWEKGTCCPSCGQFVKVYRRKLNSAMAVALISVYRYFEQPSADEWLHVAKHLVSRKIQRSDEAKLVYWDLLRPLSAERPDGSKRNGFYKITEKGRQFVRGEINVPAYVNVFNQTVYGFSDETTSIVEALGSRFNYAELMGKTQ